VTPARAAVTSSRARVARSVEALQDFGCRGDPARCGTNDHEPCIFPYLDSRGYRLPSSIMKLLPVIAFALGGPVVACGPPAHGGADAGEPCPDGGAGLDGGVARTWTCSFSDPKFAPDTTHATNCSDTNLRVDVAYSAAETAAGDVLVTALVDVPTSPPALSSSQLWSAGSTGAGHAESTLTDDICRSGGVQSAGTWTFRLDKATNVLTSVYTDADLIADHLTFTTPCTVNPKPALVE